MLPAYLRPACVTEAGAIIYGKSSLLLSKPQDLLCRGNQQPGADHHSLLHRKLDPNAPEDHPDKRFLGVGLVRRGSVITPTPPSSPQPTLSSGNVSGPREDVNCSLVVHWIALCYIRSR